MCNTKWLQLNDAHKHYDTSAYSILYQMSSSTFLLAYRLIEIYPAVIIFCMNITYELTNQHMAFEWKDKISVSQFREVQWSQAMWENTKQSSVRLPLLRMRRSPKLWKSDNHHHHHHLFAQYTEMNSKLCDVPDRKANSFSSNNCTEL